TVQNGERTVLQPPVRLMKSDHAARFYQRDHLADDSLRLWNVYQHEPRRRQIKRFTRQVRGLAVALTDLDVADLSIRQVPSGECDSISTDLYSNYGALRPDSLREDFET